jgi:integrase
LTKTIAATENAFPVIWNIDRASAEVPRGAHTPLGVAGGETKWRRKAPFKSAARYSVELPSRALALRKLDVNLDRGQLQIRSGKSVAARRTLDLTPESREILARRIAGESAWIFPAPRKLAQLSQLRALLGFFVMIFVFKSCVSIRGI